MKLNQVIAICSGEKSRKEKVLTKTYQNLQKSDLFDGIIRTYQSYDEEGEKLPQEKKLVQLTVENAIKTAVDVCKEMYDIVITQDLGNTKAFADIEIDDIVIAKNVPAVSLIFLEKQLIDLQTFISAFPVLDSAEEWEYSSNDGCWRSEQKQSVRTKKVPKNHVMYEATREHPAQVQIVSLDENVGTWTTIKLSGCISVDEKKELLNKVISLLKAVKIARENANMIEVEKTNIGSKILEYIFSK